MQLLLLFVTRQQSTPDPVRPDPEHRCTPIPPGLFPPFSPAWLFHSLERIVCTNPQSSIILIQFPKRTLGKMCAEIQEQTESWGIYFDEDSDTNKIDLIFVVVVAISSLLLDILWSELKKDIARRVQSFGVGGPCMELRRSLLPAAKWEGARNSC